MIDQLKYFVFVYILYILIMLNFFENNFLEFIILYICFFLSCGLKNDLQLECYKESKHNEQIVIIIKNNKWKPFFKSECVVYCTRDTIFMYARMCRAYALYTHIFLPLYRNPVVIVRLSESIEGIARLMMPISCTTWPVEMEVNTNCNGYSPGESRDTHKYTHTWREILLKEREKKKNLSAEHDLASYIYERLSALFRSPTVRYAKL